MPHISLCLIIRKEKREEEHRDVVAMGGGKRVDVGGSGREEDKE